MPQKKHDTPPKTPTSPKRARILDAATRLFLAEPYDRVSMDAVAVAANVSKVTIYAHFADKERLFLAAIGERCLALFDVAAVAAQAEGGLRDALVRLGTSFVAIITSPDVRALHAVMMAEGGRRPELRTLFYDLVVRRSIGTLADILDQHAKAGRIVCPDAWTGAVQYVAMVQGQFFYRAQLGLEDEPGPELGAYAAQCADLFLRAVAPGGTDA